MGGTNKLGEFDKIFSQTSQPAGNTAFLSEVATPPTNMRGKEGIFIVKFII